MAKRMVLMLLAVAVFVAGIGVVKFRQIQAGMAMAASFQPPPEAVTTTVAREDTWPSTLAAIGTVTAVQGVTVSADLPGVVESIAFESGRMVRQGDVLVRQDTRQERAQLAAAQAARTLAAANLERAKGLRDQGVISVAEFDRVSAEDAQADARVGEIQATIARKTIRAPFSGVLGIRQVNVGQYLSGGAAIVPLQSLQPVYVNFSLPQQEVARLRVGGEVLVTAEGLPGAAQKGRITAVDSVVDQATRNLQVQATLPNGDARLRPGMFVQAQVQLGAASRVVSLPTSAVSYAPYGDSVFVVEQLKGAKGETYRGVRQQIVKLGGHRGDQVAVLGGVKPGEEIVTSGVFKLRGGAAVHVNNDVRPGNDPAPRPADN
jgi:membrane fusion protein (multidrug efflux system)